MLKAIWLVDPLRAWWPLDNPLSRARTQRQSITLTAETAPQGHTLAAGIAPTPSGLRWGEGLELWPTRSPYNRGMDRRPLLLRPVSIPDDIEDRSLPKASGKVTLPRHIAWSFPYGYDLDNRKQLRAAYEQVMTEGLDDDVRFYIDLDTLLEVWDELWLSPHVREAWSVWLRGRGLID